MPVKKRILIFYDHFAPAYKAGGPVQSLVNMVRNLSDVFSFYIVCKPHEMNETEILKGIETDRWIDWEQRAKVYYWNYSWANREKIREFIKDVHPEIVFINGLFSLYFNILPLFFLKSCSEIKVVFSARGMLHPGALTQKKIKKQIYLTAVKMLNLYKNVHWHATDKIESDFIKSQIGSKAPVTVAGNFTNEIKPLPALEKKPGELVLGTIALISPMKNHLEVIKALLLIRQSVTWFVYGPVKDEQYWAECLAMLKQLPLNTKVEYKGEIHPTQIESALSQVHVFIMPSKSENFGHSVMEALQAAKPVITTNSTPFKQLSEINAGVTINSNQLEAELPVAIKKFAIMNMGEYEVCCRNANVYAQQLLSKTVLWEQYKTLFQ